MEAALYAMGAAHWTGRVANGWALIKDPAEISVADVYRLLVFRPGARLPARQSGRELDHLALEIAGGVEENLGLSLEELFRRATASGEPAVSGDQRSAANVLRLG
jgi:membrane protein